MNMTKYFHFNHSVLTGCSFFPLLSPVCLFIATYRVKNVFLPCYVEFCWVSIKFLHALSKAVIISEMTKCGALTLKIRIWCQPWYRDALMNFSPNVTFLAVFAFPSGVSFNVRCWWLKGEHVSFIIIRWTCSDCGMFVLRSSATFHSCNLLTGVKQISRHVGSGSG